MFKVYSLLSLNIENTLRALDCSGEFHDAHCGDCLIHAGSDL